MSLNKIPFLFYSQCIE